MSKYNLSPIGEFLKHFDQKHPQQSASQIYEITQQKRINSLRDNVVDGAVKKIKKAKKEKISSAISTPVEIDKKMQLKAEKLPEW